MQIAMLAAGFTAGEADELRRAMGACASVAGSRCIRSASFGACSTRATPQTLPSGSPNR